MGIKRLIYKKWCSWCRLYHVLNKFSGHSARMKLVESFSQSSHLRILTERYMYTVLVSELNPFYSSLPIHFIRNKCQSIQVSLLHARLCPCCVQRCVSLWSASNRHSYWMKRRKRRLHRRQGPTEAQSSWSSTQLKKCRQIHLLNENFQYGNSSEQSRERL